MSIPFKWTDEGNRKKCQLSDSYRAEFGLLIGGKFRIEIFKKLPHGAAESNGYTGEYDVYEETLGSKDVDTLQVAEAYIRNTLHIEIKDLQDKIAEIANYTV